MGILWQFDMHDNPKTLQDILIDTSLSYDPNLNENISKFSSYSGLVENSRKIPFYLKENKL